MTGCYVISQEDMNTLMRVIGCLVVYGGISGVLLFTNVVDAWDNFQWRLRRRRRFLRRKARGLLS